MRSRPHVKGGPFAAAAVSAAAVPAAAAETQRTHRMRMCYVHKAVQPARHRAAPLLCQCAAVYDCAHVLRPMHAFVRIRALCPAHGSDGMRFVAVNG